jgi:hypothetical protein
VELAILTDDLATVSVQFRMNRNEDPAVTHPRDHGVARPCPGGGKDWTVDIAGKPICPRCRRALSTVAGKGRSVKDTPKVPAHDKPRGKSKRDRA